MPDVVITTAHIGYHGRYFNYEVISKTMQFRNGNDRSRLITHFAREQMSFRIFGHK